MKKYFKNSNCLRSITAISVLAIFILLATGSFEELLYVELNYLGDGNWKVVHNIDSRTTQTIEGKRDDKGRFHGPVKITNEGKYGTYRELVTMHHGKRHGEATYINKFDDVEYTCYNMGKHVKCDKKSQFALMEDNPFSILASDYPWYLFTLNAFDFSNSYIKAYLDTCELILNTYEFEEEEFDIYYSDVLDSLQQTPYDSLIRVNAILSYAQGKEELKNSQLRLAVIDRFQSNENSSFQIIKTIYPNYLAQLNDEEVNDQDFEVFCFKLDSTMDSYGSLDLDDPYFEDSVDNWLYNALTSIFEENQPYMTQKRVLYDMSIKQFALKKSVNPYFEIHDILNKDPGEVSSVVLSFMLQDFTRMDLLKQALWKSYCRNNEIAYLPVVTTVFNGNNSGNSSDIQGYVIEDGGASVSSRGIAWSDFYNPTINDNLETAGTGLGQFEITISGLIEGKTYYARTFATNSSGTAYGNCIEFIAGSAVGVNSSDIGFGQIIAYPNPASEMLFIDFISDSPVNPKLLIFDNTGRIVFNETFILNTSGKHHLDIDISHFSNGIYFLELSERKTKWKRVKIVIQK